MLWSLLYTNTAASSPGENEARFFVIFFMDHTHSFVVPVLYDILFNAKVGIFPQSYVVHHSSLVSLLFIAWIPTSFNVLFFVIAIYSYDMHM